MVILNSSSYEVGVSNGFAVFYYNFWPCPDVLYLPGAITYPFGGYIDIFL